MTSLGFHLSQSWEVWVGAILSLMIFSFLYRDNPFYRVAEHILVGVSAAYFMVLGFWTTLWPNALVKLVPDLAQITHPQTEPGSADYLILVPFALGCLMLCRLIPRWSWLSRWAMAFAIGTTAGYNLIRYLRSDFLNQIAATLQPGLVVQAGGQIAWGATIDAFLVVGGTICGLAYFTYTRPHTGFYGKMARLGILVMMVTFGASFGYAVMGRVSVLIGQFRDLLGGWLGLM